MSDTTDTILDAARRVSEPSAVCSTEQVAAMLAEMMRIISAQLERPVKQGYATRSQLSAYYGYESPKGFDAALDMLLVKYSDQIRRFTPEYVGARGKMVKGYERLCIEDVTRVVILHHGKGKVR